MALLIDPANRRIVLDSANVTAQAIYRAWADWAAESDHLKYLPAFSTLGGEPLGGGRFVPGYYFLINGWRVRPAEADQHLVIDGNLIVAEGGSPVVPTLGVFRVVAQFTIPVQAQAMVISGSGTDRSSLEVINRGVQKASLLIPHTENLP